MQIFLLNYLFTVYPGRAWLSLHAGHSPVVHIPSVSARDPGTSPHSALVLGNDTFGTFATIPLEKMLSNPLINNKITTTTTKSFVQKEAQNILKINVRDLVLFLLPLEKPNPAPHPCGFCKMTLGENISPS